jgi:hypothetical protein
MIIKRVGPSSCAKIAGAIYAALGLLFGVLFSLIALPGIILSGAQRGLLNPTSPLIAGVIGVGAIVVFPIFYGLIGFVFAWIGAWLYNLVASKVGGIEIDVSEKPDVRT